MVPDECQLPSSMYNTEFRKGIEDLFADSVFRIKFCNQIIVYQNRTSFSGKFFTLKQCWGSVSLYSDPDLAFRFDADPDPVPTFHFYTVRMRIRPFTLIRIRIRLFIKVMRIFNPCPKDPSQLNFEGWTSMAPFNTSKPPGFLTWSGSGFHFAVDPDLAFHFDADPDPVPTFHFDTVRMWIRPFRYGSGSGSSSKLCESSIHILKALLSSIVRDEPPWLHLTPLHLSAF
jgi:hypothetical protein